MKLSRTEPYCARGDEDNLSSRVQNIADGAAKRAETADVDSSRSVSKGGRAHLDDNSHNQPQKFTYLFDIVAYFFIIYKGEGQFFLTF
jgi:hypothetical protein